jgi:putative transcriptional regulator
LSHPTSGAGPPVIVNRLSRLMGERRLNIQDVARLTGLSYRAVFDLYHARTTRYDAETLNRLCRALDCPLSDILEYVADPTTDPAEA